MSTNGDDSGRSRSNNMTGQSSEVTESPQKVKLAEWIEEWEQRFREEWEQHLGNWIDHKPTPDWELASQDSRLADGTGLARSAIHSQANRSGWEEEHCGTWARRSSQSHISENPSVEDAWTPSQDSLLVNAKKQGWGFEEISHLNFGGKRFRKTECEERYELLEKNEERRSKKRSSKAISNEVAMVVCSSDDDETAWKESQAERFPSHKKSNLGTSASAKATAGEIPSLFSSVEYESPDTIPYRVTAPPPFVTSEMDTEQTTQKKEGNKHMTTSNGRNSIGYHTPGPPGPPLSPRHQSFSKQRSPHTMHRAKQVSSTPESALRKRLPQEAPDLLGSGDMSTGGPPTLTRLDLKRRRRQIDEQEKVLDVRLRQADNENDDDKRIECLDHLHVLSKEQIQIERWIAEAAVNFLVLVRDEFDREVRRTLNYQFTDFATILRSDRSTGL